MGEFLNLLLNLADLTDEAGNPEFGQQLIQVVMWIFIVIGGVIVPFAIYLAFRLAYAGSEQDRNTQKKRLLNVIITIMIIGLLIAMLGVVNFTVMPGTGGPGHQPGAPGIPGGIGGGGGGGSGGGGSGLPGVGDQNTPGGVGGGGANINIPASANFPQPGGWLMSPVGGGFNRNPNTPTRNQGQSQTPNRAPGRVSQDFGGNHNGIDIPHRLNNGNNDVRAALGGRVHASQRLTNANAIPSLPGGRHDWVVVIDHGGGIFTAYFHLDSTTVDVQVGQQVRAGQHLGRMLTTHLHFEVSRNGWGSGNLRYDPLAWNFRGPGAGD